MAVQGGLQGLLSGGGARRRLVGRVDQPTATAAPSGEQSAEASTGDRFTKSTQGVLGSLGPVGQALAAGHGHGQLRRREGHRR